MQLDPKYTKAYSRKGTCHFFMKVGVHACMMSEVGHDPHKMGGWGCEQHAESRNMLYLLCFF